MAQQTTIGDVGICNEVLIGLGARPIASFNENTDGALACSNVFATVRDDLLAQHDWPCAVKRVELSPLAQAPAFGYAYLFPLPGDCIRVQGVSSLGRFGEPVLDYRLESGNILCNQNPIGLYYVWRNDVLSSWPAGMISLFKYRLRWALAYAITRDSALESACEATYARQLMLYKGRVSQEQPAEDLQGGDFEYARYR